MREEHGLRTYDVLIPNYFWPKLSPQTQICRKSLVFLLQKWIINAKS